MSYGNLEPRNLLATLVGTEGDDSVVVEFVDAQTVDITINDSTKESIDVSDGLHIDLKNGFDELQIDHRIEAEIVVFDAEELTLNGGDNHFQIGAFGNPVPNVIKPAINAGRINDNIRFADVVRIHSGAGNDVFTVNTKYPYSLELFGGEGDDVFRFSTAGEKVGGISTAGDRVEPLHVKAFGESGNDRFSMYEHSIDRAYGGEGFDIVDYRQMKSAVSLTVSQITDVDAGNDRIFGKVDSQNSVTSGFEQNEIGDVSWVINGDWTTVSESNRDFQVELMNFSQFQSDTNNAGIDHAWILATTFDVRVIDMNWVHVGSKMNRSISNLESINHDITILKTTGEAVLPGKIEINNEAGSGTMPSFDSDGVIRDLTQAEIRFSDGELEHDVEGLPSLNIFSSQEADYFVFNRIWTSTTVNGNGGDDIFMVGGAYLDTEANLSGINESLSVNGGEGVDRIFANDLAGTSNANFDFRDNYFADSNASPAFDAVTFSDMEIVRIYASALTQNSFTVAPSETTIFSLDSSANSADQKDSLEIIGHEDTRQLSNSAGTGSWGFAGTRQRVYFYGVENPGDDQAFDSVPAEKMAALAIPNRQHVYSKFEDTVLRSQDELDQFIEKMELESEYAASVIDALKELNVDFSKNNFLFFTHSETSGSNRIELGHPIFDNNKVVVELTRKVPALGTADMAYYAYAYEIDKAIKQVVFTDGETSTEIAN